MGGRWLVLCLVGMSVACSKEAGNAELGEQAVLPGAQGDGGLPPPISLTPSPDAGTKKSPPLTRAITAGYDFACLLSDDGQVCCGGANYAGQLGRGTMTEAPLSPALVGTFDHDVIDLTSSGMATCAVRKDGSVWCWGTGSVVGSGARVSATPARVMGIDKAVRVGANTCAGCTLSSTGEVSCFGSLGCLGDGRAPAEADTYGVATNVLKAPVLALHVGSARIAASLGDGTLQSWGSTWSSRDLSPVLANAPGGFDFRTFGGVSVGSGHACGLQADGTTWCWGENTYGAMGVGQADPERIHVDGAPTDRHQLAQATNVPFAAKRVAALHHTTCVLDMAGAISCFGYFGNVNSYSSSPRQVTTLGNDNVDLTANSSAICAKRKDGSFACWSVFNPDSVVATTSIFNVPAVFSCDVNAPPFVVR